MSHLMQERTKNWVLTSYLQDLPLSFFLSYKLLKSRKRKIFVPTSYIQGHVRGSRWVRQGRSVAKKGGREKEKKKTKEGGLSPQEGDVRKKKRKTPRKARRWLPRRQGSMCPQPRISFFGSRVFGFGSGPSRLKYWLLRDLVYKEAMCKVSSGNGLPYAAKAVP